MLTIVTVIRWSSSPAFVSRRRRRRRRQPARRADSHSTKQMPLFLFLIRFASPLGELLLPSERRAWRPPACKTLCDLRGKKTTSTTSTNRGQRVQVRDAQGRPAAASRVAAAYRHPQSRASRALRAPMGGAAGLRATRRSCAQRASECLANLQVNVGRKVRFVSVSEAICASASVERR